MWTFLGFIATFSRALFLGAPPGNNVWTFVTVLWISRVVLISLLLRTYIIPSFVAFFSSHIRVRSISFRSIRGLYIRRGHQTWRVDRISISRPTLPGDVRPISIKIEGLKLDLHERTKRVPREHKAPLSLADFGPSLMAVRLWILVSSIVEFLSPFFRPLLRTIFVSFFRHLIHRLPGIAQALSFELFSAEITSTHLPGVRFTVDGASLHTSLSFSQMQHPEEADVLLQTRTPTVSFSVADWRDRFAKSTRRTWDHAWGKTQVSASVSLKIRSVVGSIESKGDILNSPGVLSLDASIRLNPKRGTISRHGLQTTIRMDTVVINVTALRSIFQPMSRKKSPSISRRPPKSPWPGAKFDIDAEEDAIYQHRGRRDSLKPRSIHDPKNGSKSFSLSLLASARVHFDCIKLITRPRGGREADDILEYSLQKVTSGARLSDPSQSPLHLECLGQKAERGDRLEPDAYAFDISIETLAMKRNEGPSKLVPLLRMTGFVAEALLSQWPTPWLAVSQFLAGDPNAPVAAIRIHVDGVDVMRSLRCLHEPGDRGQPATEDDFPVPVTSTLLSLPRVIFALDCGRIRGCLDCDDATGDRSVSSIELCTDGFVISASSEFIWRKWKHTRNDTTRGSLPLEMKYKASSIVKPISLRVPIGHAPGVTAQDIPPSFSESSSSWNPAVSLDALEIQMEGSALGCFENEAHSLAAIDLCSAHFDLCCSADTLSIEFWHPQVITAALKVVSMLSRNRRTMQLKPSSMPVTPHVLDRLPFGMSASMAVSRFSLFVASPDPSFIGTPQASRGFALHNGFRIQYCALDIAQVKHDQDILLRCQQRQQLDLPEEHIMRGIAAAKASVYTKASSALLRVNVWNTVMRIYASTPSAMDGPQPAECDEPIFEGEEYLRIPEAKMEIAISGTRHQVAGRTPESQAKCQVVFNLPYVWGHFKLCHVYTMLLAIRTVKSLRVRSARRGNNAPYSAPLSLQVEGAIKTVQVLWSFPEQNMISRFDSVVIHCSQGSATSARWSQAQIWVPVGRDGKSGQPKDKTWEELLRMSDWEISFPPSTESIFNTSLRGDSARLRIPFGYMLSDLIFDATITVKCVRHLITIVRFGRIVDVPAPGVESAKSMPHLSFCVRCLSVEAADDAWESRLGLIWRVGLEASKQRVEREEAFRAKVVAVLADYSPTPNPPVTVDSNYQFDSRHSISLEDARERLFRVHAADWAVRHQNLVRARTNGEKEVLRKILKSRRKGSSSIPNLVEVAPIHLHPPLFRLIMYELNLRTTPPSFPAESLPNFLYEQGKGLPRDSSFNLLLPLHLHFTVTSLRATLRDYTLPLLVVPGRTTGQGPALQFDSDLVVAEELGPPKSVEWVKCPVLYPTFITSGTTPFVVAVPKTAMPVKTYANPTLKVMTDGITFISWGVSYLSVLQDLVRVIDTLTTPARDLSPALGFWDKIRLVFHWTITASFEGEVRLHFKGSRDPYQVLGNGAGFVFCWKGQPRLCIGGKNVGKEVLQVTSESMVMAIPEFDVKDTVLDEDVLEFRKVCAKLCSGVRFAIGFDFERTCGLECKSCSGTPFYRKHRFFKFAPHYEVKLDTTKASRPSLHSTGDSFNQFRSDFVHLSIALGSSLQSSATPSSRSSFHLTPKAFAHFWSWWDLFDDISLPIRQGSYYPLRLPTPKFARHLATIKYRISVPDLFISHMHIDDSKEAWADGLTPLVGAKAMVRHFETDLHQRLTEVIVPGRGPESTKLSRRRPFYAAEVLLKDLDLRALLAIFDEPMKQYIPITGFSRPGYGSRQNLPRTDLQSSWYDLDDFVETDWYPLTKPALHFLPVVACPRFTYFRHSTHTTDDHMVSSKFGDEDTHDCLLGNEATVPQVQADLAATRILELRAPQAKKATKFHVTLDEVRRTEKKIALLQNYINQFESFDRKRTLSASTPFRSYFLPSEVVSSDEWLNFTNVYHIHCPRIFMDSAIRDILLRYYHCSRARRGFEYYMAQRAVKFIMDQAQEAITTKLDAQVQERAGSNPAYAAATAIRKIFTGETGQKSPQDGLTSQDPDDIEPLHGWSEGVSSRKSHFCLLLKPQIVLRSEMGKDSTCIVAAVQAKLQVFHIMDDLNAEDPVCGRVMSRNYTSLTGLQAFSPARNCLSADGCVPLEILIDLRSESDDFDRLVPQTNATFHYDRFNRLRMRNTVTSAVRTSTDEENKHLQHQMDLVQVHVPQFTVLASDSHFKYISDIVTKLVLFSDAAHKIRLERLETLLFTYDFTELSSAASVVSELQGRLRNALESEKKAEEDRRLTGYPDKVEILKLKAYIASLTEELGLLFDAIKLAQDRIEDYTDQRSALLLRATSAEISWRMLDDRQDLLAKLAVRGIDFSWLSREDSSMVNKLTINDLQVFDGSANAHWPEILCKHTEPANHTLLKLGIFLLANWTVLAPVGGITIFENFDLSLHPMRLQIDAKLGARILEYLWPARKRRKSHAGVQSSRNVHALLVHSSSSSRPHTRSRTSLDSPTSWNEYQENAASRTLAVPSRGLGMSRSFTDLRKSVNDSSELIPLTRTRSSHGMETLVVSSKRDSHDFSLKRGKREDAVEMKTRSSQKTFVLARVSSLHILLSVIKEESFECHNARIRTRDLEYRNQTLSFEELVNQFIPSDTSWRGWAKIVFQQPLIPVLPVARELWSKTKWIASKGPHHDERMERSRSRSLQRLDGESTDSSTRASSRGPRRRSRKSTNPNPTRSLVVASAPVTDHELTDSDVDSHGETVRPSRRVKMLRMLSRREPSRSRETTADHVPVDDA